MSAHASTVTASSRRRLRLRHVWIIPGLAIAVYANAVAGEHDLGLVPLLLFGILPNVPLLFGIGQPTARRQLAPRAVPLWNAMHHPATPLALFGVAATGILPAFWLVGALAWLGHVVVDWGLGDGLRSADGFVLGPVSRLIGAGASSRGAEGGR